MVNNIGISPDYLLTIGKFTADTNSGVSTIQIVQRMESADSASLVMDNMKDDSGKRNFDKIAKGDLVEIELGYKETGRAIVFSGNVVSRKPSLSSGEGASLTIECAGLEFNLLSEKIGEDNSFTKQILYSIASSIISSSGLTLNIINAPTTILGSPSDNPVLIFDEEMTKMEVLKSLADQHGYDIVVLSNKIMTWYPKDVKDGQAIQIKYAENLIAGEVDDAEASHNVVTVKAGLVNEETTLTYTAEDSESLNDGQARREIIVYNAGLGDAASVQEYAESLLEAEKKKKITGQVSATGSPSYKKRGLVNIQDDGSIGLRGIFEIQECTHIVSKLDGYRCDMLVHKGEVEES